MQLENIAIRLAEDNIPIAIIARACQMRFSEVEEKLRDAIDTGRLISLPTMQATIDKQRQQAEDMFRLRTRLKLSLNQAFFVATILRSDTQVSHERLAFSRPTKTGGENLRACVAVHISYARQKLRAVGVVLPKSIGGYYFDPKDKERLLAILYDHPLPKNDRERRLALKLSIGPKQAKVIDGLLNGPIKVSGVPKTFYSLMNEVRRNIIRHGIEIHTNRSRKQWELAKRHRERVLDLLEAA